MTRGERGQGETHEQKKREGKVREMMRVDRVDSLKVTLLLISLLRHALFFFFVSILFFRFVLNPVARNAGG